jgi:hypothetical protein
MAAHFGKTRIVFEIAIPAPPRPLERSLNFSPLFFPLRCRPAAGGGFGSSKTRHPQSR